MQSIHTDGFLPDTLVKTNTGHISLEKITLDDLAVSYGTDTICYEQPILHFQAFY